MKASEIITFLLITLIAGTAYGQINNRQYKANNSGTISNYDIKFKNHDVHKRCKYDDPSGDFNSYYFERIFKLQIPVAVKGFNDLGVLHNAILDFAGSNIKASNEFRINSLVNQANSCDLMNIQDVDSIPYGEIGVYNSIESKTITFVKTLRNIIIYQYFSYAGETGCNGYQEVENYLNFDMKENSVIHIEEIFNSSQIKEVLKLVNQDLDKQEPEHFEAENLSNFIINENSITFVFNILEVSRYGVKVEIPLRDLAPYLSLYGRSIMR